MAMVRDPAFQHALLDVVAFLLAPPPPSGRPDGAASDADAPEQVVGRRLDKLHARLKRDAKRFEQLDDHARHGVRKRLKRLRYLGELVAPMYKRGRVRRFLGTLEPAQDELGRYIDLVVAARLAHEVVDGGDARAWFNVGWLKAQLPGAVERCGKACAGRRRRAVLALSAAADRRGAGSRRGLRSADRPRPPRDADLAVERPVPVAEVGGGAVGRLEEAQHRGVGIGGAADALVGEQPLAHRVGPRGRVRLDPAPTRSPPAPDRRTSRTRRCEARRCRARTPRC